MTAGFESVLLKVMRIEADVVCSALVTLTAAPTRKWDGSKVFLIKYERS